MIRERILPESFMTRKWLNAKIKEAIRVGHCQRIIARAIEDFRLDDVPSWAFHTYILEISFLIRERGSTSTLINCHDLVPKVNSIVVDTLLR